MIVAALGSDLVSLCALLRLFLPLNFVLVAISKMLHARHSIRAALCTSDARSRNQNVFPGSKQGAVNPAVPFLFPT